MKLRELSQKIEMLLAPGHDVLEVIARGNGGACQKQQDLGQRMRYPPRLPLIVDL
jgi:hypothetical protein